MLNGSSGSIPTVSVGWPSWVPSVRFRPNSIVVSVLRDGRGVVRPVPRYGRASLWKDAARRKFDVVAAWSVDRLGRSLADVATFMVDLKGYGVGLYLHAQAVDTTTPGGKALLQMAGVFAEFEREMIRERVLAGQARARACGVRFGRPTIPADKAVAIVADLKAGVGVVKLAKLHRLGVGTVQKLKGTLAA